MARTYLSLNGVIHILLPSAVRHRALLSEFRTTSTLLSINEGLPSVPTKLSLAPINLDIQAKILPIALLERLFSEFLGGLPGRIAAHQEPGGNDG